LGESFDFIALQVRFRAARPMNFPAGATANRLRGALGRNLKLLSPDAYARWFAPSSRAGPSGLRDLPRPFVLRVGHLEGQKIEPGAAFCIRLNVFDENAVADLARALPHLAIFKSAQTERISLPFDPRPSQRIRVEFLSPTELKNADQPAFAPLWARLRDRISTLRALYGPGPLKINFTAMGDQAAKIRMSRCEIRTITAERVSGSTGQRHSLGGFVGFTEYEGDLSEFVPYLEIGRHTGVGRQTVWGKGEIRVETF